MTLVSVVSLTADATLIVIAGAVGAHEIDTLRAALGEAARVPSRRYVVDCTDAVIDDPDAITALYELAGIARARDGVVALATGRPSSLRNMLDTSGLKAAFSLYDSRGRALDDLDLPDPAPEP